MTIVLVITGLLAVFGAGTAAVLLLLDRAPRNAHRDRHDLTGQSTATKGSTMTTPHRPAPQPQYAPPPPPAARKKPRRWPWILGILAAFGLGAAVGSGGGSSTTATPTTVTVAPAPAGQQPTTQAPPAATGPKTEFGDGTYKVGEDIAAGTYKSTGPRAGMPLCYWARMKNDSGGLDAIIANNNSQGPTRVTVKAGEYLQVTGCDFVKA